MVFVQWCQHHLEIESKLEIDPYIFNHHYDSNKCKILALIPPSVKMMQSRLCCSTNQTLLARSLLLDTSSCNNGMPD